MMDLVSWCLCVFHILGVYAGLVMTRRTPLGCIWRSSISPTMPPEQEAAPRSDCSHGELWWYYPTGRFRSRWRHEATTQDFTLCLQATENNYLKLITDETNNRNNMTQPPKLGEDSCVHSYSGWVILTFQAPEPNLNVELAVIQYSMKPS